MPTFAIYHLNESKNYSLQKYHTSHLQYDQIRRAKFNICYYRHLRRMKPERLERIEFQELCLKNRLFRVCRKQL